MLKLIWKVEWRVLWQAAKATAVLFGLVGLVAWFAQGWIWWFAALSALVVLGALAAAYALGLRLDRWRARREARAFHSRVDNKLARRALHTHQMRRAGDLPADGAPSYCRRFVRFNPDTGEEEFKVEAVN